MVRLKASPTERIAGYAFFAFTLIQVPYFITETQLSSSGLVLLSPLQLTAANLAATFPDHASTVEWLLIPGGWTREALSPYIQCKFRGHGSSCATQLAHLTDLGFVRKGINLNLLVRLLDEGGLQQARPLLYGSTMIVVSALFSLVYSVKTAVLGFLLVGYGIVQGNHIPLPPGVLTAFLCVYAGFNLGELRGNLRQQQQQRAARGSGSSSSSQEQQQQGAVVKKLEGGGKAKAAAGQTSSSSQKGSGSGRKQRKQA